MKRPQRSPSTGAISLRRRVYLLMGVGVFFPLVVMGGVGLYWLRALDERLLAVRLGAASAVAAHLDSEVTEDFEMLQRLGSTIAGALADGEEEPVKRAVRDAHHLLRHREAVFILDVRGKLVAAEPEGAVLGRGGGRDPARPRGARERAAAPLRRRRGAARARRPRARARSAAGPARWSGSRAPPSVRTGATSRRCCGSCSSGSAAPSSSWTAAG